MALRDGPWIDPAVAAYCAAHTAPAPNEVQRRLKAETESLGDRARMQISPEQGAFLQLLVRVSGARTAVEVGTFTGYSALAVALALPDDGRLIACDVSDEWTTIARRYWDEAGVAAKIELHLGPAIDTLRSLPDGTVVDFAFIDADKSSYLAYYEALLERLRPGGLIVVDNTLWSARVLRPEDATDDDTQALVAFNDTLAYDERVDVVLLPVADGLTLARKR